MMKTASAARGTALMEFAIITPLLLFLIVGIVDLGRFAYYSILVGNAAHAGASYGSQDLFTASDTSGMQNATIADGQNVPGLQASPAPTTYTVCWNGTTATATTNAVCTTAGYHAVRYVQVSATGSFSTLVRYPGLPTAMSLTRQATMRVQLDQ